MTTSTGSRPRLGDAVREGADRAGAAHRVHLVDAEQARRGEDHRVHAPAVRALRRRRERDLGDARDLGGHDVHHDARRIDRLAAGNVQADAAHRLPPLPDPRARAELGHASAAAPARRTPAAPARSPPRARRGPSGRARRAPRRGARRAPGCRGPTHRRSARPARAAPPRRARRRRRRGCAAVASASSRAAVARGTAASSSAGESARPRRSMVRSIRLRYRGGDRRLSRA